MRKAIRCLPAIAALSTTWLSSCSKQDADSSEQPVLVTDVPVARSSVWVDSTLRDGKAEWHPFRVPEDKPPVDPTVGDKGAAARSGGAGPAKPIDAAPAKRIEAGIRDLIKEHNDLIAEGKLDDALEYWVAGQRETVKQVSTSLSSARASLSKIADALKAKLPEAQDRVSKAIDTLGTSLSLALRVDSILVKSETEADGFLAANPAVVAQRFRAIDEEWYFEVPEELVPLFVGGAEKIAPVFDAIAGAVNQGAPAETILQQLETMAAASGQAPKAEEGGDAAGRPGGSE